MCKEMMTKPISGRKLFGTSRLISQAVPRLLSANLMSGAFPKKIDRQLPLPPGEGRFQPDDRLRFDDRGTSSLQETLGPEQPFQR